MNVENPKNKYARELSVYEADNGYLLKVGCQYFVCEGDSANLCDDLQAYLKFDPEILKKYEYKGTSAFKEVMTTPEAEGDEEKLCYSNVDSTAYAYLHLNNRNNGLLVKTVYEVVNGTVTIDHKSRLTTVKQNEV